MLNSTLCYLIRGDEVLMLHRVKKKHDVNKDKWIGVGGKFLENESPDECLLREVREETYMYLFTADGFTGDLSDCDEGDLQWVSRAFLDRLPKWEGDQIFLDLLWRDAPFFLLTLRYDGDRLTEAVLNGQKIR